MFFVPHRWCWPWKVQWQVHSRALSENGEIQTWENIASHSELQEEKQKSKTFFFRWWLRLISTSNGNCDFSKITKCDHIGKERETDNINWMITKTCYFYTVVFCNLLIGPLKYDHTKQLIMFPLITFRGFHCSSFIQLLKLLQLAQT